MSAINPNNSQGPVTTITPTSLPVPTAIRDLTATPSGDPPQVHLSWTRSTVAAPNTGTRWRVRRISGRGSWVTLASSLTSPTYTDTGVSTGATYQYEVRETNNAGDGPVTTRTVTVSAPTGTKPTATITATPATWTAGDTSTLAWGSSGATSVRVETQDGLLISTSSVGTRTISGPDSRFYGQAYRYYIRATNAAGTTTASVAVVVTAP